MLYNETFLIILKHRVVFVAKKNKPLRHPVLERLPD